MNLNDYQREANRTDQAPGNDERALMFPLMGLASEVGSLVNQYKKRVRDGDAHALFSERVSEELGDVLWYVANLSEKLGLSLEEIAQLNLKRVRERWPGEDGMPLALLDDGWPPNEQLPRQASVSFYELREDGRVKVHLLCEGTQLGDHLTDMSYDRDGYRFHDAFHLTYAAMLGWSPITRSFFDRKRESDPEVREVEDSGRAKVIEEAIAAFAFDYARQEQFLKGVPHLDFTLLQTIISLSSHLEVRVRTAHHWERAILRSFDIWRDLHKYHGGTVHLDLQAGSVTFEPPSP